MILYILHSFSETIFPFTQLCSILTFLNISFFKATDKLNYQCLLGTGVSRFVFFYASWNFLVYCMSINFGLYAGYPENYDDLFKYSRKG